MSQNFNVPESPLSHLTRRTIIRLLGFGGLGFTFAGGTQELWAQQPPHSTIQLIPFTFTVKKVNPQGQVIQTFQKQRSMFVENLGDGVELEMVAIDGGSFTMGAPATEKGSRDDERPQRSVTIQPFFMGKYVITQKQWKAVMGNNPSYFKGENKPVERVTWKKAVEFCQKLSQKTGKAYRLPSEAEWEYACRAGTTTPFHFGETITTNLVNYNGNYIYGSGPKGQYRKQTTDVGFFQVANEFGLYNMQGNVREWCQDVYYYNYHSFTVDGGARENYNHSQKVNQQNNSRLLRGGSWFSLPRNCCSAFRIHFSPDDRYADLGFRVACSLAV